MNHIWDRQNKLVGLKFMHFLKPDNGSPVDTSMIAGHLGDISFASGVIGLSLGDFR